MKRPLLLLIAALVVTTITAQTRAHAEAPPGIQAGEQCTPDCTPDLDAARVSEPARRGQLPPATTPTVWLAVLLCVVVTTLGFVVAAGRVRKYSHSSAVREAQMLQEWAIGAAQARKRMESSAQSAVHSRPEPKVATAKRSPIAPIALATADCYWTYQARQLG